MLVLEISVNSWSDYVHAFIVMHNYNSEWLEPNGLSHEMKP